MNVAKIPAVVLNVFEFLAGADHGKSSNSLRLEPFPFESV